VARNGPAANAVEALKAARRPRPGDRDDQRGAGAGDRRHHHPPTDPDPVDPHRGRPGDPGAAPPGRPHHAADRHGQRPQRGGLSPRRAPAHRASGRLPGGAGVHRAHRGEPRLHEPAPEVQRDHHGLSGELHPRGDSGPGPGPGRAGGASWLQRARGRQDGFRRLPDRLIPRRVRDPRPGPGGLRSHRGDLPGLRTAGGPQQGAAELPPGPVGRGAVPGGPGKLLRCCGARKLYRHRLGGDPHGPRRDCRSGSRAREGGACWRAGGDATRRRSVLWKSAARGLRRALPVQLQERVPQPRQQLVRGVRRGWDERPEAHRHPARPRHQLP
jgi:hypothetical protein